MRVATTCRALRDTARRHATASTVTIALLGSGASFFLPVRLAVAALVLQHAPAQGRRVVVENEGWDLIGDLMLPLTEGPYPAALLLHKAAGSRDELEALAVQLARRGIASLRLDLRGHGESTNRGRFDPDDLEATRHLIAEAPADVSAALEALPRLAPIDPERVAVVGASYTGEAAAAAARAMGRYQAAYVAMSPGDFSAESIAAIDGSGADWLMLRAAAERPFFDELFADIEAGSDAEIRIVPSDAPDGLQQGFPGHATRMLQVPGLVEEIADWIAARIGG